METKTTPTAKFPSIKPRKRQSKLAAWFHEWGYCRAVLESFKSQPPKVRVDRPEETPEYWEGRLARAERRVRAMAEQVRG